MVVTQTRKHPPPSRGGEAIVHEMPEFGTALSDSLQVSHSQPRQNVRRNNAEQLRTDRRVVHAVLQTATSN